MSPARSFRPMCGCGAIYARACLCASRQTSSAAPQEEVAAHLLQIEATHGLLSRFARGHLDANMNTFLTRKDVVPQLYAVTKLLACTASLREAIRARSGRDWEASQAVKEILPFNKEQHRDRQHNIVQAASCRDLHQGRLGRLRGHVQRVAQPATTAAHEMRHQGGKDATRARAHRRLQQQVATTCVTAPHKFPLDRCLGFDLRGAPARHTIDLPAKVGRSLLGRRERGGSFRPLRLQILLPWARARMAGRQSAQEAQYVAGAVPTAERSPRPPTQRGRGGRPLRLLGQRQVGGLVQECGHATLHRVVVSRAKSAVAPRGEHAKQVVGPGPKSCSWKGSWEKSSSASCPCSDCGRTRRRSCCVNLRDFACVAVLRGTRHLLSTGLQAHSLPPLSAALACGGGHASTIKNGTN